MLCFVGNFEEFTIFVLVGHFEEFTIFPSFPVLFLSTDFYKAEIQNYSNRLYIHVSSSIILIRQYIC